MKNTLIILFFSLLSVGCLAQSNDEMAVKKVIIDETDAFIKVDSEKEMLCYAHEPYTTQQYNNDDGSVSISEGWDTISKGLKAYFKANSTPNFVNVERSNWKMKMLTPDWYWVYFDQIMTDVNGKAWKSKENRLMQRINSQWKIASMVALRDVKK